MRKERRKPNVRTTSAGPAGANQGQGMPYPKSADFGPICRWYVKTYGDETRTEILHDACHDAYDAK